MGVAYVVAPYEADAQLAALALAGAVDAVVTEDSDLLAFGTAIVLRQCVSFICIAAQFVSSGLQHCVSTHGTLVYITTKRRQ
jgi:hypothetical protein